MVDIDRMVSRLVQLIQDSDLTASLGSSSEDSIAKMLLRHHL